MRRPSWWPASLWPSGPVAQPSLPGEGAAGRPERAPSRSPSDPGRAPPAVSFLRTLVAVLGATRADLWLYRREEGTWTLEREACVDEEARSAPGPVSADGHPLTWALREGLVLQVPCERLEGLAAESGWAVLGPVPGSRRALGLVFPGSPPAAARKGVEAALHHLADLETAGYLRPS